MYPDIILLVVVHDVDVTNPNDGKNLITTIGMFPDVDTAKGFRSLIMGMLNHRESAVIIHTNCKRQVVYHDVETVVEIGFSNGEN